MRTLSRSEYDAMTEAWADFDYRWKPWRELAARSGVLFPPSGSKHDSIEDEEPSQRAIVFQAMTDTPAMLREAIGRSHSWREIVGRVLLGREHLREDATLRARDDAWERRDEPTHREALETLGALLTKIGDSVGASRDAA